MLRSLSQQHPLISGNLNCSHFLNLWKLTTLISLNYGNQLQIINLLLGATEVVHYSHCSSLPVFVEHLTHSQQKLDGSLAINFSDWSPCSLTQSPSVLHHQVRVSRAWKSLQILWEEFILFSRDMFIASSLDALSDLFGPESCSFKSCILKYWL